MSRRLNPVSWRGLIKGLKKFGWEGPYEGGKHPQMVKDENRLTIPNPKKRKDVPVGLLAQILREAGISHEEWAGPRQRSPDR